MGYFYSHLPDEKEHWHIQRWVWHYRACDDLNIACEFGEKWGTRQMTEPTSGLSKMGREICAETEKVTGVPTYCYLCSDHIKTEQDHSRPCPVSGKSWFHGASKSTSRSRSITAPSVGQSLSKENLKIKDYFLTIL